MSFLILGFILIVSTPFLILSIENWLFLWIILELSSVGFIIFMGSLEMSVIYFLTQTFGSVMVLFHLVLWKENLFFSFSISPIVLLIGLILKMGVIPMHQWFLNVGSKIKKSAFFMLMTIQKMAPLFLFKLLLKLSMISIIALLSAFLGVFFQLGVFNLKELLLYSSIVNMGWLILLSLFQMSFFLTYFFVYSIILLLITPFLKTQSISIMLGFLSLAGIPPLLGFFSKMIALKSFSTWSELWGFFLLILSVINVFVYFRAFTKTSLKTPMVFFPFTFAGLEKYPIFLQLGISLFFMIL